MRESKLDIRSALFMTIASVSPGAYIKGVSHVAEFSEQEI